MNTVNNNENESKWTTYGLRIFLSTLSHPFEYAKVLIQIGYEPFPPQPSRTLLGRPAMKLPNVFHYIRHIYSVDGFTGCYKGLTPKLCGSLVSAIVTQKIVDQLGLDVNRCPNDDEDEDGDGSQKKQAFLKNLKADIITHSIALIAANSFHVITVRMMAEFVGRETTYSGILSSFKAVYVESGISGFFAGLVPRWLGDILTVLLANSLTYIINRYLIQEKELQEYTAAAMCLLSTSIMYPFQVVSNCISITDSGLMAGKPPYMPQYENWIECWSDLSRNGQLKRGSSLLIRYYTSPHNRLDSAFAYKAPKFST